MISKTVFLSLQYRFLSAALVAALGLGVSQTACAQTAVSPAPQSGFSATGAPIAGGSAGSVGADWFAPLRSAEESNEEGGQKSGGAISQGFKMHGHWVIDVKNPDGTLVQHRAFENALEPSGPQFLIGLMSGYFTPGDYMILLGGTGTGNGPCQGASAQFCGIARSLATSPAIPYCSTYYCGTGLNYTYNIPNSGPYSMVLSGQITSNLTGTIGTVYTLYNSCANTAYPTVPTSISTTAPTACVTNTTGVFFGPLSMASITGIPVTSGQIIQVTVTITFS